ncbi:glycosyltransferase family 2 protein [Microbacterium sp. KCTC 39802]|uniref:glycosyltransferase family 2 protein n=1 Tax=Microbacterium sp. KCTC 39802 TaxID=2183895 RepID=UPI0023B7A5BA|nr:glycosyltransferase family 2 protein [Microbacterium sp. KCTC 39802]
MVLPTHNRAGVLERSLNSVLHQTHYELELIVIDDGSADHTHEIVQRIASVDSRVRYITQPNAGAPAARNRGVSVARGEYLAFQDSDDAWEPEFLERLLPFVVGQGATVAFASHRLVTSSRAVVVPAAHQSFPRATLRRRNIASTQTVLMPRALAIDTPFDEGLQRFQDWELWLRMLRRDDIQFVHVHEPLVTLYRSADSISGGSAASRDRALHYILCKHRTVLQTDPIAMARLAARAYLRSFWWLKRVVARGGGDNGT